MDIPKGRVSLGGMSHNTYQLEVKECGFKIVGEEPRYLILRSHITFIPFQSFEIISNSAKEVEHSTINSWVSGFLKNNLRNWQHLYNMPNPLRTPAWRSKFLSEDPSFQTSQGLNLTST